MRERQRQRTSSGVAVVGIVIGLAYLMVGGLRGHWGQGVAGLVIMIAYAGLMYGTRRRSEAAQLLSGNPADERQAQVMLRATAATGQVLIAVILIAMMICLAVDSRLTEAFVALAAVAGVCFIASTAWYARRT